MWDLSGKDLIAKTLGAHIANVFDTIVAARGLSKNLVASSSFIGPIGTFIRLKATTTLDKKKYSFAKASKDPMDTAKSFVAAEQVIRQEC